MYRPALQERLRGASASRPTTASDSRPQHGSSRPQSASSMPTVAHSRPTSAISWASSLDNRSDDSFARSGAFQSRPQSALSSALGTKNPMREDAKLVFQQLQRIQLDADYTLKFNNVTGTCSGDILQDYLRCLEQHAVDLESPFSMFLQQEREYCKERADVLEIFHQKYLELVRISFKQCSAACNILRQFDEKKQRDANSAYQANRSVSQVQSLLDARTAELTAVQSSFAQTIEEKQTELLVSQTRCIELENELKEVIELRDEEIAKSKQWYQWELQFAEDKLDQAELKIQLLQENISQLKTGLVISAKREQVHLAATQTPVSTKGTQTFWKTGENSAFEMPQAIGHTAKSDVQPVLNKSAQPNTSKESGASHTDDDDDDDDIVKSRLRKFLIPPAAGDIQAMKRKALVELILDGTLESGSIEYLKAVDTGKALSKALLLKCISEIYATRTLLMQAGESISPYLTHDLGRFTLAHYRKRFGLKRVAEKRTSGIIRSVRVHRAASNRIDLFGQFCGIDSSLPSNCLQIYIKLLIYIENMPEAPHIENEEATAVCWVPLEKFVTACENVLSSELDPQDLEDIFEKAEQIAIPNNKKKNVLKINFDKICCTIFSKVIHTSRKSELDVTEKLLHGLADQTGESGITRRIFYDVISAGNPSILKSSTDLLYDEGIKKQYGILGFNSDDGRLKLGPQFCSDIIAEFVLDGAPGHAPSQEVQIARQTALDALTTFWMRNGKLIETKMRETQLAASRLAQTMHLFFKGYLEKENILTLWILTRSMIADLNLGQMIADRTQTLENEMTAKMQGTVKKLMMVCSIEMICLLDWLSLCLQVRKLRSSGRSRSATRISSGPGPAATLLNDPLADANSAFATAVSLRDEELPPSKHSDDLDGQILKGQTHHDEETVEEELTMLPRKFLADPDNAGYEDLLLQIYGPDAGKLLA
jgi:hypothetical protein